MKAWLILLFCIFMVSSTSWSATTKKVGKVGTIEKGKYTMKPGIDFDPKKIVVSATNLSKTNKMVGTINVENREVDGSYKLVFHDYNVDEYGKIDMKAHRAKTKNIRYGMLDWIKYDPTPFRMIKNEKKTLRFEVEIPKNAVGSKYAHFTIEPVFEKNYVESINNQKESKNKAAFEMKVNVIGLLILDIPNSGIKKVEIDYAFDEKFKRHFASVKNIGDHFIANPSANVLVLDANNKMVEKLELKTKYFQLNPQQRRVFHSPASKKYTKGKYTSIVTFIGESGNFASSFKKQFDVTGAVPGSLKNKTAKKKK
jgi:hypothetical protein